MHVRLTFVASALVLACASTQSYRPEKLEPALRLMVAQRPDTVVAVLLRLTQDVQREDSLYLTRTGFTIGSARGRIVTGVARADALRRLSAWSRMEWMEMSATVPLNPRRFEPPLMRAWQR